MRKIDLENAITITLAFLLIVLCLGTPDILDGLIKRINGTTCEQVKP